MSSVVLMLDPSMVVRIYVTLDISLIAQQLKNQKKFNFLKRIDLAILFLCVHCENRGQLTLDPPSATITKVIQNE